MFASIIGFSALLASSAQPALAAEQNNAAMVLDERFYDYQKPGPGDSLKSTAARSPCPGINTLANHGFVNRDGKDVNFIQLVTAAATALGTSPEVGGFVAAVGLASSSNPFSLGFNLEDLREHLFLIEHDCSISRNDAAVGDNNDFNPALWDVALNVLNQSDTVTPMQLGRAKAARIDNQKQLNPDTDYGPRAALFGGVEMGMILNALSTPSTDALKGAFTADGLKDTFGTPDGLFKAISLGLGNVKLEYLRSIFEEERLPTHLGWMPTPETNNVATTAAIGGIALLSSPELIQNLAQVFTGTPADALGGAIGLPNTLSKVFNNVIGDVQSMGYSTKTLKAAYNYLQANGYKIDEQMIWNVTAAALSNDA